MTKFEYSKLVRDEIPRTMAQSGEVQFRQLERGELTRALLLKIIEEAQEALDDPELDKEQVGDIGEPLACLVQHLGILPDELNKSMQAKRELYGSFHLGYFVETVEVPSENKWYGHLKANPDRYPEVE